MLSVLGLLGSSAWAQDPPEVPAPLPLPEPESSPLPLLPEELLPPVEWRYILIHHSASPSGNAASFDRMHRRKGWDGLAYHFVINNGKGNPDGHLEVSSRWKGQKHGAHAGGLPRDADPEKRNGFNEFGIGICLVGNFEKRPPTRAQMRTLSSLVARLRAEHGIAADKVLGHRHVKSTACPGRHFPWRKLYAMMALPRPRHLYRQAAYGTHERCPWCRDRITVASSEETLPLEPKAGLEPSVAPTGAAAEPGGD